MGFKLGSNKGLNADGGNIRSKLKFGTTDKSIPGTPIIRKDLGNSVMGEANDDGSIYLSNKLIPGSTEEDITLRHEMIHLNDMKISKNKLSYGDDHVRYNGRTYPRKTINGKDMIKDIDTGEWKIAGDPNFPWEKRANNI